MAWNAGILSLDYVSQVEIEGEQGPQDAGNGAFVKLMEKVPGVASPCARCMPPCGAKLTRPLHQRFQIRLAYRSYTCKYQDILDGVRVQPLRRADSRNHAGYHERKGFAEIPSAGVEAAESPSNGGKLKVSDSHFGSRRLLQPTVPERVFPVLQGGWGCVHE